jgi:hypothetical protein
MSRSQIDLLICNVLTFGIVCLAWRSFARDPTDSLHQILSTSQKESDGDHGNDWTIAGGRYHQMYMHIHWKSSNLSRRVKSKVKRSLIIFFDIEGMFTKSSSQNVATRELTTVSQQRPVSHYILRKGILYQEQHECQEWCLLGCYAVWLL